MFALCLLADLYFLFCINRMEREEGSFPWQRRAGTPHCRGGFVHRGCAALSPPAKALERVTWKINGEVCLVLNPQLAPVLVWDSQGAAGSTGSPRLQVAPGALWEAAVAPHDPIWGGRSWEGR